MGEYLVHTTGDLKVFDYGGRGELVIHGPDGSSVRVTVVQGGIAITSASCCMRIEALRGSIPAVVISAR